MHFKDIRIFRFISYARFYRVNKVLQNKTLKYF